MLIIFFTHHFFTYNFFSFFSMQLSLTTKKKVGSKKVLQRKTLRNLNLHLDVIYLQCEHMVFIEFGAQHVSVAGFCFDKRAVSVFFRICGKVFFEKAVFYSGGLSKKIMWQRSDFFVCLIRLAVFNSCRKFISLSREFAAFATVRLNSPRSQSLCTHKKSVYYQPQKPHRAHETNDDDRKLRLHRTNTTYAIWR